MMVIKLWVDDIRPPPSDDWVWVKTYKQALQHLTADAVEVISLDHDLSDFGHDKEYTGYDILLWLAEYPFCWPKEVRIHSANPVGRQRMIGVVKRYAPEGTLTDTMPAPAPDKV